MKNFIAFDTETTGIEPGSRMLELAAIRFNEDGEKLGEFCAMVNPHMPLPPDAAAVNGITPEMMIDAFSAPSALESFLEWLPPDPTFIAHNASFDCGIIAWEAQYARIKWNYEAPVIDTLRMARAMAETPDNKLQTLVAHCKFSVIGDAHRAMADADCAMRYFLYARKKAEPSREAWELTGYTHVYVPPPDPIANLPVFIAGGLPFTFTYRDAKEAVTTRTLIPYGYAMVKDAFMFHGLDSLRGERRTFRADRIISVLE